MTAHRSRGADRDCCRPRRGTRRSRAIEAGQALDPTLFKQFEPATDRVVVQQKRIGDFLTAPPVVQKHQGICASRHARGHRPFARQRDQLVAILFAEKPPRIMRTSESAKPENSRIFYRDFNESEYRLDKVANAPRCKSGPSSCG